MIHIPLPFNNSVIPHALLVIWKDGYMMKQNIDPDQKNSIFSGVGYSIQALIGSISWGTALVICVLAVAWFMKYPVGLPVGGTNSAVISAACHLTGNEREKKDIVNRPLTWGVTVLMSRLSLGHCFFSAEEVYSPVVGDHYAGHVGEINTGDFKGLFIRK
ncbi:hypothetical protein P280DRAFT_116912 [Massarina eburnea CBS 473.64]|uniref:Uncharacterized protein n=1 Tax=Massarina eburnea CBS 473.64 TaxID=1395130 RepID=A0A6A6SF34_9PLEO|nr:hypothetical protein P280DRAFT_116912 [Massarina eburnea CBS 473.64]